jgi:hypothetical protein
MIVRHQHFHGHPAALLHPNPTPQDRPPRLSLAHHLCFYNHSAWTTTGLSFS